MLQTHIRKLYTSDMFAKLKKKLAEEAAAAPRAGRIPRSMSKESITSVGADSGDDFVSTNLDFCLSYFTDFLYFLNSNSDIVNHSHRAVQSIFN